MLSSFPRPRRALSLAAAAAATLSLAGAAQASAATEVREGDVVRLAHGTPFAGPQAIFTRDTGTAAFELGPVGAPLGAGSLTLDTPLNNDKVYLFHYQHAGTPLSAVEGLKYSTYRHTGAEQQVAAINLGVDVNGAAPGGFTTLVFEPVYNTGQGAVVSGQWQTWDAVAGGQARWWSSNPIPSAPNRDTFVSLDTIRAANPGAVIAGGYGTNQGGGNPGLKTSVDALTFDAQGSDAVVYDYEAPLPDADNDGVTDAEDNCVNAPNADQADADNDGTGTACDSKEVPTAKEDCTKDGYKAFDGDYAFATQGDCVSFVASKGKNAPKG